MLYAIKDGIKIEASPNQQANCTGCGNAVRSYCGDIYTWHWKHDKKANCDEWFESESEWHLNWKKLFERENTEVRISKDDTWHIADIYTNSKVVIELQYSAIDKRVIELREDFYGDRMFWLLHPQRLDLKPVNLDVFYIETPMPFTVYFDKKELGFPIWIVDLLHFNPSESLRNCLRINGFIFDENISKYYKRSSLRTFTKIGFNANVKKDLIDEIKSFSREIMKQFPYLKKFYISTPQKAWSYSNRNIFIDKLADEMFWIKSFKNGRYGLMEKVSKETFIKKYASR